MRIKSFLTIILLCGSALPLSVRAQMQVQSPAGTQAKASIWVQSDPAAVAPLAESAVSVMVNVQDKPVNAISGEILLDRNLSVARIEDGSSAISLWIERPIARVSATGTIITFAGISPGGIMGTNELFTIFVKGPSIGRFEIRPVNIEMYAQSRDLEPVRVTEVPMRLSITDRVSSPLVPREPRLPDTEPPTGLSAAIDRSPDILEGRTFLAISAVDKHSGIGGYEVAITRLLPPSDDAWQRAENPYILSDQALGRVIWVRAIDRAGNLSEPVRVYGPRYYTYAAVLGAVVLGIIVCILLCTVRFLRQHASSRRSS